MSLQPAREEGARGQAPGWHGWSRCGVLAHPVFGSRSSALHLLQTRPGSLVQMEAPSPSLCTSSGWARARFAHGARSCPSSNVLWAPKDLLPNSAKLIFHRLSPGLHCPFSVHAGQRPHYGFKIEMFSYAGYSGFKIKFILKAFVLTSHTFRRLVRIFANSYNIQSKQPLIGKQNMS